MFFVFKVFHLHTLAAVYADKPLHGVFNAVWVSASVNNAPSVYRETLHPADPEELFIV